VLGLFVERLLMGFKGNMQCWCYLQDRRPRYLVLGYERAQH
jgi:hypothetical protein